jgi:hypothetical protein
MFTSHISLTLDVAAGVHIVTVASAKMVMYLQPEAISRPLKACVGEEALTAFGEGTVEKYNSQTDMYTIKLRGWGAKLYAKGETFDRVPDFMRDKEGPFGMNWLLNFFFSSNKSKPGDATTNRSRSNSIVSGSGRSHVS